MLKLLIADDERIIRETIFNIIDWKKHDIEVIGLCKNGIEAYDMILDESPDIVLTDIRMPGMGGLELIRKIRQTDLQIQFIILSGYGEFEYAKEAMSYGIRHYLLKPCNETQILECIEQCRKDHEKQARERKMLQQQFVLYDGMFHSVLSSIINDCLDEKMTLEEIISPYEQYLDFHFAAYRLFYVYYLEFQGLPSFLQQLKAYMEEKNAPDHSVWNVCKKIPWCCLCRMQVKPVTIFMCFCSSFHRRGRRSQQRSGRRIILL